MVLAAETETSAEYITKQVEEGVKVRIRREDVGAACNWDQTLPFKMMG